MVLICISLKISDEHLFMCLLTICISSLEKCVPILDINTSPDISFTNISSYLVGCFFHFVDRRTGGYYAAIKKNEILPCVTWMDLEGIILNEISQTEKDK